MSRLRHLVAFTLPFISVITVCAPAQAATPCPVPTTASVVCTEWTSRFDGARDRAYVRLPASYDPARPIDVLLWFKAFGQGDEAIADPGFHALADELGVITIGLRQRGIRSFLGDSTTSKNRLSEAERLAAKQDVAELLDQLAARFRIGRVIAAGASMGGYASLRLAHLFPRQIAGVIAAVPALCSGARSAPPDCEGSFIRAGSQEVLAAAAAGAYADKLVVVVAAGADRTAGVLAGQRELARLLTGQPWFRYHEVAGAQHENFLAGSPWFGVEGVRDALARFLAAHPGRTWPSARWTPPDRESREYLVSALRERGGAHGDDVAPDAGVDVGPEARPFELVGGLERDGWERGKSGALWKKPGRGCGCHVGQRDDSRTGTALGLVLVLGFVLGARARARARARAPFRHCEAHHCP